MKKYIYIYPKLNIFVLWCPTSAKDDLIFDGRALNLLETLAIPPSIVIVSEWLVKLQLGTWNLWSRLLAHSQVLHKSFGQCSPDDLEGILGGDG